MAQATARRDTTVLLELDEVEAQTIAILMEKAARAPHVNRVTRLHREQIAKTIRAALGTGN